jgi:hypothetical protein
MDPKGATTPTLLRQTVSSPRRMLTIFWSPLGFAMAMILSKGAHFDATYFFSEILSEID